VRQNVDSKSPATKAFSWGLYRERALSMSYLWISRSCRSNIIFPATTPALLTRIVGGPTCKWWQSFSYLSDYTVKQELSLTSSRIRSATSCTCEKSETSQMYEDIKSSKARSGLALPSQLASTRCPLTCIVLSLIDIQHNDLCAPLGHSLNQQSTDPRCTWALKIYSRGVQL